MPRELTKSLPKGSVQRAERKKNSPNPMRVKHRLLRVIIRAPISHDCARVGEREGHGFNREICKRRWFDGVSCTRTNADVGDKIFPRKNGQPGLHPTCKRPLNIPCVQQSFVDEFECLSPHSDSHRVTKQVFQVTSAANLGPEVH